MKKAPTKLPLPWPTSTAEDLKLAADVMMVCSIRIQQQESPFFSVLLDNMGKVQITRHGNQSINTMATNGVDLFYNAQFVLWMYRHSHDVVVNGHKITLTGRRAVEAIILHEVMHKALDHCSRRNKRNNEDWNTACDWIVNAELDLSGIHVLQCALRNPDAAGMSAEQAFGLIPKKDEQDKPDDGDDAGESGESGGDPGDPGESGDDGEDAGSGEGEGKPGEEGEEGEGEGNSMQGQVLDHPELGEHPTDADISRVRDALTEELTRAQRIAEQAGNMPGNMKGYIAKRMEPSIDWRDRMREWMTDWSPTDYNFNRPSMQWLARDLYAPSLREEAAKTMVVLFDTSGSIYNEMPILNSFIAEVEALSADLRCNIVAACADMNLIRESIREYAPGDEFDPSMIMGGGGTSFTDALRWVTDEVADEHDIGAVVYFTDTWGGVDPDVEPDVPVLWAAYGKNIRELPFGETIHVTEEC